MKKLYERFKAELLERSGDMYYDEDDIIMIYDMAGDFFDRYVQLQALMLGRKLFPDSERLEIRLGLAMLDMYDGVSIDDFIAVNTHRKGILWDIIRLRARHMNQADVPAELDSLLERYTFEDDEEIIQFINLISIYECDEWLAMNYERFVDRCSYRDTALYECAEALRYSNTEIAIKIIDELTKLDPFNADAWIKLAELYRSRGELSEAIASLEYAKALRPDDYLPLFVEATILVMSDPASQSAAELLQKVISVNPDMYEAKMALSDIYENQGKSDMAEMIWAEELRRNPDDRVARNRLGLMSASTGAVAKSLYDDMNEDELATRLEALVSSGFDASSDTAIRLLSAYDRVHGLYQLAGEYIKLLYKHDMFDEICDFMEKDRPDGAPEMRLDPTSLPLYAASQLRLGRYREAGITAREYLVKAGQVCTNAELSMAFAGVKIVLSYILRCASEESYDRDRDPVIEALKL